MEFADTGSARLIFNSLRKLIFFVLDTRCVLCTRPWFHPSLCPSCQLIPYPAKGQTDWVTSSLLLNENGRQLLHRIKYQNRVELLRLLNPYLPPQLPWSFLELTLVPVPLSYQRFYQRGFNQSEWLANQLSKKLNLQVENRGLRKMRDTLPQSTLDKIERTSNLNNAFQWKKDIPLPEYVCLIDDVFTTGETLKACRKALEKEGISKVFAWTLFRKTE